MKLPLFSRKILCIGIVFLALLTLGIGTSYYLTRQYPKEWNYWKNLPGSVKRLTIELELERLWHRVFPPPLQPERYAHVTVEKLEHAVRLGADWILAMQEPSGRFQYWYEPVTNQWSRKSDDNFLRQAGTSFSLMLVYEMTGDPRYLEAARRSIRYLLVFKKQLDNDKAYFLFRKKAKLGGISLPMLTMLKIRQLTGSTEFDETLLEFANMILFLQAKYQTGQYKSTYVYRGDYEYEKNSGWESRIYPGEALFALANMYQAFGDARYKQSMDWALEFYYRKKWKSHAFLPWTISAFVSLYKQTGEPKYADYVFFLSNQLLTQQNLDSNDEVYGSFHGLPAANTGSYMEGLGDAIHLAQLIADEKRLQLYRERAKMGYRWLFLLQYTEADIADLKRPELALGGFRSNLADSQLRIDNTQHAISAFTKGLRFIFGVPPVVPAAGRVQ
ncbi:MAG: hypothetical protein O7E52_02480 [Candidatus Poribacteria bacterium]|nr:hypothetical protein [Candidatus Poribacteria bacterium]